MSNLRKLDLNLLVTFEAIYSAGSISRAGRALGLSQPTVSNALSRLRGSLSDPLFIPKGQGVEPTQKAKSMIGPVREALLAIEDGVIHEEPFNPETTVRHFRVLLLDLLEPVVIPAVLRKVQNYRSITLEALPPAAIDASEGLNSGSLDLVLSTFINELPESSCEPVGDANLVVVAREDHPDIDGSVSKEQFETLGHIALIPQLRAMSRLDEVLSVQKINRHIVYTVSKFWSFPHILAQTDLIALLPGDFAGLAARRYGLKLYPAPFDVPQQQFYMTWKTAKSNDPGHQWLREQILAACAESLDSMQQYLPPKTQAH